MKRTALFFVLLLGVYYSFAQTKIDEVNIPVDDTTWRPPTRSLGGEPPALYLHGNAILIDSSSILLNLQVIVTDLSGYIEYDSYITVYAGVEYSYSIANLAPGNYKVELRQGIKYLYGYFAI